MKNEYRQKAKRKLRRQKVVSRKHLYQKLVELTICEKCGECDINKLTRHHKRPQSKGGSDLPENIIVLCERCHKEEHS